MRSAQKGILISRGARELFVAHREKISLSITVESAEEANSHEGARLEVAHSRVRINPAVEGGTVTATWMIALFQIGAHGYARAMLVVTSDIPNSSHSMSMTMDLVSESTSNDLM
jgi:hypothetical protein